MLRKQLILCVLLLLKVMTLTAGEGHVFYSFKSSADHKTATLKLKNVIGEKVVYSIVDEYGKRYLHKMIEDVKSANDVLNFNYLPEGHYVFTMEFNDRRVIKTFSVNEERVAVMERHKMVWKNKPFHFNLHDKQVELIIKNDTQKELDLEIVDENGFLVYSTTLIDAEIKKRFNLKMLPSGTYSMKIEGEQFFFEDSIDL